MGSLTNYGETAAIGHLCLVPYTPAATLYLALCTADPGEAATGASMNELPNSGGYARTAITFGAAALRRVTQDAEVLFPVLSGAPGTASHWAIVDSATHGAGNALAYGAFTTPKALIAGNRPRVASGAIYVEIPAANGVSTYAAHGLLDRMFRNQAFTVSANWLALVTSAPADSATGSTIAELAATGAYARARIYAPAGSSPAWNTVSGGATDNAQDVAFPTATGSWSTYTHAACCDASTAGNLLWYIDVADQGADADDDVYFPAGSLDVAFS